VAKESPEARTVSVLKNGNAALAVPAQARRIAANIANLRDASTDAAFFVKRHGAARHHCHCIGGGQRAQARRVRFGRKLKLTPHQRQEALARREAGEALAEIGRSYNVSHSTISRLFASDTVSP